jgi:hypothetical protein
MKYLVSITVAGIGLLFLFSCTAIGKTRANPNMIADMDPVSAGTVEAEFDRMFSSKLAKSEIEVIFYPRLNSVALQFKYQTVTYRQFWNLAARMDFISALERYKSDYAGRDLDDKYRRTRAIYGKTKGRLEWETFKFTKTHVANTMYEIGYRFREEKPFFATLMLSAREETETGDSSPIDSQQIAMYFTRAQADELAALFDQSYLLKLINVEPAQNQEEVTGQNSGIEYEEWD